MTQGEFDNELNEMLKVENDEEKAAWLADGKDPVLAGYPKKVSEAEVHRKNAKRIHGEIERFLREYPEFT